MKSTVDNSDNVHNELKDIHAAAHSNSIRSDKLGMHKGIKHMSLENDYDPSYMAASSSALKRPQSGAPVISERQGQGNFIVSSHSANVFSPQYSLQISFMQCQNENTLRVILL